MTDRSRTPAISNILDVAGLLKLPQLKRHTDDYLTLGAIHKVCQ